MLRKSSNSIKKAVAAQTQAYHWVEPNHSPPSPKTAASSGIQWAEGINTC
jgi:hypothetical protein